MRHEIRKETLQAVRIAASTDETRVTINGVHFAPTYVEATDGHRLHRVTHKEPIGDGERTVTLASVDAAIRTHGKAREPMVANAKWEVGDGVTLPVEEREAEWPNTNQVIPKSDAREIAIGFNAQYLRDACDAAIKLDPQSRSHPIVLRIQADKPGDRPVKITATTQDGRELLCVIMPMSL